MRNIWRRLLDTCGRGGIKCPCCNPKDIRGSYTKEKFSRRIRTKLKRLFDEMDREL